MIKRIAKFYTFLVKHVRPIVLVPVLVVKRVYWAFEQAWWIAAASGQNWGLAMRMSREVGAGKIDVLIMVFVAFVILYQLIPSISNQNAAVQDSANVSAMGKFAAGLGEWMFPLFGILGLVFLLWNRNRGKKGGDGVF